MRRIVSIITNAATKVETWLALIAMLTGWGFFTWLANQWQALASQGWAAILIVGIVCTTLVAIATSLIFLAFSRRLILQTKAAKQESPTTSNFVPIFPLVDMVIGPAKLIQASPWLEFYCIAFNATLEHIELKSARGRIKSGIEEFHGQVELILGTWQGRPHRFFLFHIKIPVTSSETAYLNAAMAEHYIPIEFVDVVLSGVAQTQPTSTNFEIRFPSQIQFQTQSKRPEPAFVEQVFNR